MTEYRWAKKEDYINIIEFANHVFDPKHWTGDFEKDTDKMSYFPRILPKLYQNIGTAEMHRIAVRDDGTIVGCVGNFILPTYAAGEKLNVIGIGTVSTHPEHRREGHMIRLMDESIAHAKEVGADYMVLGGQRQRYGHWGFESAGPNVEFRVYEDNVRKTFGKEAKFGYTFRKLLPEDREYIMKERLMRTSALTYTEHEKEQEYAILFSMGSDPYVILKDGEFAGTFMKFTDHNEMTDLRLVNPEEVLHVVNDLLKDDQFFKDPDEERMFRINHIAQYDQILLMKLAEEAESTEIGHCQMIKILNYARTIGVYLKMAAAYRSLADGEVKLAFENGEKLKITVRDGVPAVEAYDGEDCVFLKERPAVDLLFGEGAFFTDFGTGIPAAAKSWFPLPFFQYMSDEV